jgi:hypothetical protein
LIILDIGGFKMVNVSDDMQKEKMRTLSALVKTSVKLGKTIEDIIIPNGVSKSYFYTLFGDECVLLGSVLSNVESRKAIFRQGEKCYKLALESVEKYSTTDFSADNLQLRLDYLKKNLMYKD